MSEQTDPYLWLEDLEGERATAWARDSGAAAMAALATGERFERLRDELRSVLNAAERIPLVAWRGEHLYNFWRDAAHPRGLWRRTTLASYATETPDWDVLLDLDALAEAEDEPWVWQGADLLPPRHRLALLSLSRGGADAHVVREFDLDTREFVPDGFTLPEAKSYVDWVDEDHIYVGTDFGAGSLTSSGYPRIARLWRRGTPLEQARLVFEGEPEDMMVVAQRDHTPGFVRDVVTRRLDFFRAQRFLRTGADELVRLEVPDDADVLAHREWLLVRPRSSWTAGGVEYPAGSLLAVRLDGLLAGVWDVHVVFAPDERSTLDHFSCTRNHLLLGVLHDVSGRLDVASFDGTRWRRAPTTPSTGDYRSIEVVATNRYFGDEYLARASAFTSPAQLWYADLAGSGVPEVIKREPEFFAAAGITTAQYFATSADGTQVPYFVVGRGEPGAATLITGYGGFEISLTPKYDPIMGRGWLERGGTFVVANIRGGGEYGPRWHDAALLEHRHRAYEDFAAVAQDLLRRGLATPGRLGIEGGSNGGLLMGVMLTSYPSLFDAVVCQVPLLDMRRYHLLHAGASWMAEYGDPDNEADWAYISQYSPYQMVRRDATYPPVLILTSTRDDRVHPAHARKMVARLREYGHDVTYYENVEGGHAGAADNEQSALRWALAFEFLWQRLSP